MLYLPILIPLHEMKNDTFNGRLASYKITYRQKKAMEKLSIKICIYKRGIYFSRMLALEQLIQNGKPKQYLKKVVNMYLSWTGSCSSCLIQGYVEKSMWTEQIKHCGFTVPNDINDMHSHIYIIRFFSFLFNFSY